MTISQSKYLTALILTVCLCLSCSKGDAISIARAALSGNPAAAAQSLAVNKAVGYAFNPEALLRDVENFLDTVGSIWGASETKQPTPKEFVKYVQNYRSRAMVDFDRGFIAVETVDQNDPLGSLRKAIITTLLAPHDPRAVDLYSANPIKLGDTPFLYGEVVDFEGQKIRWDWRAERFADWLLVNRLGKRVTTEGRTVHFVTMSMVPDHLMVRAAKFAPLVEHVAQQFGVSQNLIYAIIKTESDFNPFAINSIPAVGLMQVVPQTAGTDVYQFLNNSPGTPDVEFLFQPGNNMLYGTAYLHLLGTRFFGTVANPISREYCMIAGYNGGPGAVARVFGPDNVSAVRNLNSMPPAQVYDIILSQHPALETRNYLIKVLAAKRLFVNTTPN